MSLMLFPRESNENGLKFSGTIWAFDHDSLWFKGELIARFNTLKVFSPLHAFGINNHNKGPASDSFSTLGP